MTVIPSLHTPRLLLRPWRDEDLRPFAAMNADPEVMRFMPAVLSAEESDRFVERIRGHFEERGFGLWAVELVGEAPFIGFVGLSVPRFEAHFTPCVEIGWRLASYNWNRGLATEAARAAMAAGFATYDLEEIVSFTTHDNLPSRRVMEKLGMTHSSNDDFEHPALPTGHPMRPHVLYRMPAARWAHLERT